jgi:RIO-like serine/threonine protein kinase
MYPDTTIANPKVIKILLKNGFDKYSFAEQFKKYSANPQEFRDMLDTARERAKKEYQILRKNDKTGEIPME